MNKNTRKKIEKEIPTDKDRRVTRPRMNPYGKKGVCQVGEKWVVKTQHPGTTMTLSKEFDNPTDANSYYGEFPYEQVNF